MTFTAAELERYRRQIALGGWGEDGQAKLKKATIFLAGAGGLGSSAAFYLAASGVGRLIICDSDVVDLSNLNRQILHRVSSMGLPKVLSAQDTLASLNPGVEVVPIHRRIDSANVDELVGEAQIIVDCLDNFECRFVLNDAAIRKGIPFVHGSVCGFEGRLSSILVPLTPCLRCLFPEAPPPEPSPVVGAAAGVIGALQATEAIKILMNLHRTLMGQLLVWDGTTMGFHYFKTRHDLRCPACRESQRASSCPEAKPPSRDSR